MTCVAWDGKSLAADRQASNNGYRTAITKLWRLNPYDVAAITGSADSGILLLEWYRNGADPERWPERQKTDEWARLIIANASVVCAYEQTPVAIRFESPFVAFGSGRDFAIGAMAMGASAREAVLIAGQHSTDCGMGVDVEVVRGG